MVAKTRSERRPRRLGLPQALSRWSCTLQSMEHQFAFITWWLRTAQSRLTALLIYYPILSVDGHERAAAIENIGDCLQDDAVGIDVGMGGGLPRRLVDAGSKAEAICFSLIPS